MPLFLDTRGRSTLGIGICARCSRKMSLDELRPDPNYPGLRVCADDLDDFDPWRLPAPPADQITLEYPRPDTPLYPFEPIPQWTGSLTLTFNLPTSDGLYNNGGVLALSNAAGWPVSGSAAGGMLWSNGGEPTISPGFIPEPMSSPVRFGYVSASMLLLLNGAAFPFLPPKSGSGILWNPGAGNGGPLFVA